MRILRIRINRDLHNRTGVQFVDFVPRRFEGVHDGGQFRALAGGRWGGGECPSPALPAARSVEEDDGRSAHGVVVAVPSASAVDLHFHCVDHDAELLGMRCRLAAWEWL